MIEMVFDEFERTDLEFKKPSESDYDFLNRSALPEISQCREYLEKLYFIFPEKKAIRGSIRSGDDDAFISACTELYFHSIFTVLDFEISPHPEIDGISSKPDWLLTDSSGNEFYCEATVSFPEKSKHSGKKNQERVRNYLRINLEAGMRVSVHFSGLSMKPIKLSLLKKEIMTKLEEKMSSDNIDPRMESTIELNGFSSNSISAVLVYFPKIEDVSEASISLSSGIDIVTVKERIRRSLGKKANKYGKVQKPFVIALNIYDYGPTHEFHINEALLGSALVVDRKQGPILVADTDGFWGFFVNTKYTRISGILTVDTLDAFTIDRCDVTFWHNPYAQFPISPEILPFRQKVMINPKEPIFSTIPAKKSSFDLLFKIL